MKTFDIKNICTPARGGLDFCLLWLVAVLLPYDKIYGNIAIALAAIWALYRIIDRKKYGFFTRKAFWSMALPVLVIVAGILFSSDIAEGWNFAGHVVSLVVFPLIVSGLELNREQVRKILWGFVLAYTFRAVWVSVKLGITAYQGSFHRHWYFQEFGNFGGFHPTYMGMYSVFAIILLLYLFRPGQKYGWFLVLGLFHVLFLFILASRMALIAFVVAMWIYSLYYWRRNRKDRKWLVAAWILMSGLSVFIMSKNRDFQFKFAQMKNISWKYNKYDASSIATRVAKWKSAIEIGKHSLWTGSGTGDLPADLLREFRKLDCRQCLVKKYNNPHNQFLDAFARNGLPGLIAILFFVGFGFFMAVKERNVFFRMYLWVLVLLLLSECMLNREKGVEAIAFLHALFLYGYIAAGTGEKTDEKRGFVENH